MSGAIFHAFKSATDGSGKRWDHVGLLTHEQARDEKRFPLGRHFDEDGTPYIWTYALMPRHVPSERTAMRALGSPTQPVTSAASAILAKITTWR